MKLSNQTILISGGTSGIGLALAQSLAKNNKIILLGRNLEKLQLQTKYVPNFIPYQADVSKLDTLAELLPWIKENYPELSILINSAGIMTTYNLITDQPDIPKLTGDIQTNLIGTMNLTSLLLPHLLEQNEAMIVNVSSGLANLSSAAHPAYSASKAGVHMFTSALRDQLSIAQKSNLHVMELVPPLVSETNLEQKDLDNHFGDMKLADLVKVTLKGMETDKKRVNAGAAKIMRKLGQIAPDSASKAMSKQNLEVYFPDTFDIK